MTPEKPGLTRRSLLGFSLVVTGLASAAPLKAMVSLLKPTPPQSRGPFYPLTKPLDQDNDLVVVRGKSGRAQGRLLHVLGRVMDQHGKPVPGGTVEIWQANAFGRYHHPHDRGAAPADPYFQGYGRDLTDAEGVYRFRTVQPAPYPASPFWMRPPHIHFALSAPGFEPLVTQMYFAGNRFNEHDFLLNGIPDPAERARLIVALQPPPPGLEPDSSVAVFDIVLRRAG